MLSCKEASALMSKSQDRRLSLKEKVGLRFHLLLCAGCRQFERQLGFFRAACQAWKERK